MRLWHYKLLPYLPKQQLLAQWRELQSIFAKQNRHILINYVYEYPKLNLWYYTKLVSAEMRKRGMNFSEKAYARADNYFGDITATLEEAKAMEGTNPFPEYHTNSYLLECYFNLQEKYNRGCDYISENDMEQLTLFIANQFKNISLYDTIMFLK